MHVAIVSDTICPWCYIGKRRFERANAGRPADLAVEWRPYQLNPDMPAEGVERLPYLVAKFGSEERVAEIFTTIEQAGEAEGIQFVFDQIGRTPNTVDSHRLIEFAGQRGVQDGGGRGSVQTAISNRARTSATTAYSLLPALTVVSTRRNCAAIWDGSDGVEEIKRESEAASRAGISGVPCFIFERRYAVTGAQTPDVFERVFELAAAAKSESSTQSPPPPA